MVQGQTQFYEARHRGHEMTLCGPCSLPLRVGPRGRLCRTSKPHDGLRSSSSNVTILPLADLSDGIIGQNLIGLRSPRRLRVLPPKGRTPNDLPPAPTCLPRPGFVPGYCQELFLSGRLSWGMDGFPMWWSRGSLFHGPTNQHL